MNRSWPLVLAALLGCAPLRPPPPGAPPATEDGAKARALVAMGALLLDVRSAEEYAAGHLEGAVNVPIGQLEGRLAELGPKERPIVVYCKSGLRAWRAEGKLKDAGFARVFNLARMTRW